MQLLKYDSVCETGLSLKVLACMKRFLKCQYINPFYFLFYLILSERVVYSTEFDNQDFMTGAINVKANFKVFQSVLFSLLV